MKYLNNVRFDQIQDRIQDWNLSDGGGIGWDGVGLLGGLDPTKVTSAEGAKFLWGSGGLSSRTKTKKTECLNVSDAFSFHLEQNILTFI